MPVVLTFSSGSLYSDQSWSYSPPEESTKYRSKSAPEGTTSSTSTSLPAVVVTVYQSSVSVASTHPWTPVVPEFGLVPRDLEVLASAPASPLDPPSDWSVDGLGHAALPLVDVAFGVSSSNDFNGSASIDLIESSMESNVGCSESIFNSDSGLEAVASGIIGATRNNRVRQMAVRRAFCMNSRRSWSVIKPRMTRS